MKKLMIILVLIILAVVALIYVQQPQQTQREVKQQQAEKREEVEQIQPRPTTFVQIYYLDDQGQLIPLKRTVPQLQSTAEQVKNALEELTKAPVEKNISSAIPEGTKVLNVEVKDNIAYTDFNQELEKMGGSARVQAALDQIIYTATGIEGVDKVRLLVEGKAIDSFTGEGIMVDQPLGRKE